MYWWNCQVPDLTGTYDDGTKIRYKNYKNLFDSVVNKKHLGIYATY